MPKRTNQFQKLIFNIEQALAGKSIKVEESANLDDSGITDRECDILISSTVNQFPIKIAVECRDHTREQTIEWIDGLIGKYMDLKVDKVIAVSKNGFVASAMKKAEKHGIGTYSLEEAENKEWAQVFSELIVRFIKTELKIRKVVVETEQGSPGLTGKEPADQVEIVDVNTGKKCTLQKDVLWLFQNDALKAVTKSIQEEAFQLFREPYGKCTVFHIPYVVSGKRILTGSGEYSNLNRITIDVSCEVSFNAMESRYFEYKGLPVIENMSYEDGNQITFYLYPSGGTQPAALVASELEVKPKKEKR